MIFTIESFFSKNTSNDFISLTLPLILSNDIGERKKIREVLKRSFALRNEIVHGNKIFDIMCNEKDGLKLFFDIKIIAIKIFRFYVEKKLYNRKDNIKINHEFMFNQVSVSLLNR